MLRTPTNNRHNTRVVTNETALDRKVSTAPFLMICGQTREREHNKREGSLLTSSDVKLGKRATPDELVLLD
jgi:hypothetical protein